MDSNPCQRVPSQARQALSLSSAAWHIDFHFLCCIYVALVAHFIALSLQLYSSNSYSTYVRTYILRTISIQTTTLFTIRALVLRNIQNVSYIVTLLFTSITSISRSHVLLLDVYYTVQLLLSRFVSPLIYSYYYCHVQS